MLNFFRFQSKTRALPIGIAVSTIAYLVNFAPSAVMAAPNSKASFPDIQNHWARPFIEPLAEKDILAGYLDGTFRPNQPIQRDEFAAVIRKAFEQKPVREIESGSVYKDVPSGYWAAPAIKEAYETGFMTGYPGQVFRPNQNLSRVEALVLLENNLNLLTTPKATQATTQTTTNQQTTQPTTTNRAAKKRIFLPMAMTNLMQPLVTAVGRNQVTASSNPPSVGANNNAASSNNAPAAVANQKSVPLTRPAPISLSKYYVDADKIPADAVSNVVTATKANIVVNYPNPKVLNPNQPATRGDIAAFVYQALVAQGRIEPLPNNVKASNYIIGTKGSNQNTQTAK